MSLPTFAKTWSINPCNRVTYVSYAQVVGDAMFAIKNILKAVSGVTVAGSSNGSTAAMDATDRWVASANVQVRGSTASAAQSWIVLNLANAGGAQLLMTYLSSSQVGFSFYFSPGGLFAAAGTATYKPTATDEVTIRSGSLIANTTADRLWTTWAASDGSAVAFAFAGTGVWESLLVFQLATARVDSPATFSPAVIGFQIGTQAGGSALPSAWGTAYAQARVNMGSGAANYGALFGCMAFGVTPAPTLWTGVLEANGGGSGLYALSAGLNSAGAHGTLCNFTDLYTANGSVNDGDTYGSRALIKVGGLALPWNGTTSPVMS